MDTTQEEWTAALAKHAALKACPVQAALESCGVLADRVEQLGARAKAGDEVAQFELELTRDAIDRLAQDVLAAMGEP